MAVLRGLREKIGRRRFRMMSEPERTRKGSNFSIAGRVGILYSDQGEDLYNQVRTYAKQLKEKHGIRTVRVLGFIDLPAKQLPSWQSQKIDFEFFTRDDLNWSLHPGHHAGTFIADDFDILIDLSGGDVLPLAYVFKESIAGMKVGWKGSLSASCCDLMIDMGTTRAIDPFIDHVNFYLSNPKLK